MKWLLSIPFLLAVIVCGQSPVVTFFNRVGPAAPAMDTNGLLAWYRADAEAYAQSASVTNWTDQHAAFDLIDYLGAGTHPTFQTNQVNGYPALLFDGTDDILYANAVNHTGTGVTVLAVVSVETAKNFGIFMSFNEVAGPPTKIFEQRLSGPVGGTNMTLAAYQGASPAVSLVNLTNVGFRLIIARRDDTAGISGITVHPNAEITASEAGTSDWYRISVGDRVAGVTTLPLHCRVAEMAVFGFSLGSLDMSNRVNYFTNKYNLQ